jgi:hypothetical protein
MQDRFPLAIETALPARGATTGTGVPGFQLNYVRSKEFENKFKVPKLAS